MSFVKGGRDLMYYPCQLEHRVILAPVSRLHLRDDILCVRVESAADKALKDFCSAAKQGDGPVVGGFIAGPFALVHRCDSCIKPVTRQGARWKAKVPVTMGVRWCVRLTRLTLLCEVIRYRLVQIRQNLKKRLFGLAARNRLSLSRPLSFSPSSYFLSFSVQKWKATVE